MAAHAVEGIRLQLKVESYLLSINVAMPLGLAVNELMTNALKHALRTDPAVRSFIAQRGRWRSLPHRDRR